MFNRRAVLLFLAVAGLLLGGGCGGRGDVAISDETSDADYRRGMDLKRQGRSGEALDAFLKVIDRRGVNGAPESHLEAGALLLQRDPFEAYHHFTRYLTLQPTGPNAALVDGQRNAAKREMARILLFPQGQGTEMRVDSGDIEQLRRRVQELEAENRMLQGASSTPVVRAPPMITLGDETSFGAQPAQNPAAEPPIRITPIVPVSAPVAAEPDPAPQAAPAATVMATVRPVQTPAKVISRPATQAATPSRPQPATTAGRRQYVVTSSDKSLWGIARRYYGPKATTAQKDALFQANRGVMRNENDLRAGMVLQIP